MALQPSENSTFLQNQPSISTPSSIEYNNLLALFKELNISEDVITLVWENVDKDFDNAKAVLTELTSEGNPTFDLSNFDDLPTEVDNDKTSVGSMDVNFTDRTNETTKESKENEKALDLIKKEEKLKKQLNDLRMDEKYTSHSKSGNKNFKLVVMRGIPGCGKTELSNKIKMKAISEGKISEIYSADDYFIKNNEYLFNKKEVSRAHDQCQTNFKNFILKNPVSSKPGACVIIDNTNIQKGHMAKYVIEAHKCNYSITLTEPSTPWKRNPKICKRKNVHNVPYPKIDQMHQNWEMITADQLIKEYITDMEKVEKLNSERKMKERENINKFYSERIKITDPNFASFDPHNYNPLTRPVRLSAEAVSFNPRLSNGRKQSLTKKSFPVLTQTSSSFQTLKDRDDSDIENIDRTKLLPYHNKVDKKYSKKVLIEMRDNCHASNILENMPLAATAKKYKIEGRYEDKDNVIESVKKFKVVKNYKTLSSRKSPSILRKPLNPIGLEAQLKEQYGSNPISDKSHSAENLFGHLGKSKSIESELSKNLSSIKDYNKINKKLDNYENQKPKLKLPLLDQNQTIQIRNEPTTLIELSSRAILNITSTYKKELGNRHVPKELLNPAFHLKSFSIPKSLAIELAECWLKQAKNLTINPETDKSMEEIWSSLNCVPRNTFTKIEETKVDKVTSLKQIQEEEKIAKISEQRQNEYLLNIKNDTISHSMVEERMMKCFGDILEADVVKQILQTKNYDMKAAAESIAEMTGQNFMEYKSKLDKATIWHQNSINIDKVQLGIDFLGLDSTEIYQSNQTKRDYYSDSSINQTAINSKIFDKKIIFEGESVPETYVQVRLDQEIHRQLAIDYGNKLKNCKGSGLTSQGSAINNRDKQRYHKEQAAKCSKTAAMILLSNRNRSSGMLKLDLHGLHEQEALEALKNRLAPEISAYVKGIHRINKLEIITGTGRGKPSSKGRLREAVLQWLKNKKMNFEFKNGNDGCFVVKFA